MPGRFVRTYTSSSGNFTDRAEYVAGGIPYTWYRTKTSAGLSAWKRGDTEIQGIVDSLGTELSTQSERISRGTGEAWLTAADIPNYRTLKPGGYRAPRRIFRGD